MKIRTVASVCAVLFLANTLNADIVEIGQLNIIDDASNPSDGLAFIDPLFSAGQPGAELTAEEAVELAELTFGFARLATPSEFNDFFAAGNMNYNGALLPSDGFTTGGTALISSGENYDNTAAAALGVTQILGSGDEFTGIWTDPEGVFDSASTRDLIYINQTNGTFEITQQFITPTSTSVRAGFLIVTSIPEPSSAAVFSILTFGLYRRSRH